MYSQIYSLVILEITPSGLVGLADSKRSFGLHAWRKRLALVVYANVGG